MTSDPRISVVVPAYNVAEWIGETLDSVLAQTSPADEIVVVDDGSSDDLQAALVPYREQIRFLSQDNAGCGYAFNTAITAAKHDFVALCPADDVWAPGKLAWQRETLREHPEVDVSFTAAVNFGLSDEPAPAPSAPGVQPRERLLREIFVENVIPDPSVVLRKSLHERLGGFVAEIGEDYEFWMRALVAGAVFHFDPRVGVRLRKRGSNLSANAVAIWGMVAAIHRTHADALGDDELAHAVLARDNRRLARARLGLGDVAGARVAYADAHRYGGAPADRVRATALALPGAERAARLAYDVRRGTGR